MVKCISITIKPQALSPLHQPQLSKKTRSPNTTSARSLAASHARAASRARRGVLPAVRAQLWRPAWQCRRPPPRWCRCRGPTCSLRPCTLVRNWPRSPSSDGYTQAKHGLPRRRKPADSREVLFSGSCTQPPLVGG